MFFPPKFQTITFEERTSLKLLFPLHLHQNALSGMSLDGVGVGQRWADRADGGQVHGSPEDRTAGLVPEHGGWRDVAEQHLSQKGSKVGGSDSRAPGRVSAGAPKITGTISCQRQQSKVQR